jgi:WD repeat and SOF domain-containing protein 1
MRYLDKPFTVHMDHVSAVLDVDYSPTGKEFVSASFDKTIRIFPKDSGHSRLVVPGVQTLGSSRLLANPGLLF